MQAVVFKGPNCVAIEDRPVPTIKDPKDVVLKVRYAALCGSDLHFYRGHQKLSPGFIVGHEFTGVVAEVGSSVTQVKVGDEVVVPFSTACGECFFCTKKQSSRCENGLLFGKPEKPFLYHDRTVGEAAGSWFRKKASTMLEW
jgi:threonine dehydrogenase-like Zn-dependent dehydrogenase